MPTLIPTPAIEVASSGRTVVVPGMVIQERRVIVTGRWVKKAEIHDEDWLPGPLVRDVRQFVEQVGRSPLLPDLFSFAQPFTDPRPRNPFPYTWDNIAAVPITSFDEWWEKRVSHDLRKDVKRAEKRGVQVREVPFGDRLVCGIKALYDETPFRQGRRFWHYGKDPETVARENSTYLERSFFLGAFLGEELIGFIKIVMVDQVARMMQILARDDQQDKRPMNALIAKAVEVAHQRKATYLTYGKYTYDGRRNSSVALFKRRNGFEEILFPRYFVPFTLKGSVLVRSGLHLGFKRLIPESVYERLRQIRGKILVSEQKGKSPASWKADPELPRGQPESAPGS